MRGLRSFVLGMVLVAGPALAQEVNVEEPEEKEPEEDAPADEDAPPPPPSEPGTYKGVSPDVPPPAGARKGAVPKRPSVTWIGFAAEKKGGRAFVQLSHSVPYDQTIDGREVVFRFPNVRMAVGNYDRPIYTSFFDVQVSQVTARRVGARKGQAAGVELRIKFKDGATPASLPARVERGADGFQYLFVDVP